MFRVWQQETNCGCYGFRSWRGRRNPLTQLFEACPIRLHQLSETGERLRDLVPKCHLWPTPAPEAPGSLETLRTLRLFARRATRSQHRAAKNMRRDPISSTAWEAKMQTTQTANYSFLSGFPERIKCSLAQRSYTIELFGP